MTSDEIYDDIQEVKTAFIITLLIGIYCFSVILESIAMHIEWKVICSSIGFLIVTVIDAGLLIRLVRLYRQLKSILKDSN